VGTCIQLLEAHLSALHGRLAVPGGKDTLPLGRCTSSRKIGARIFVTFLADPVVYHERYNDFEKASKRMMRSTYRSKKKEADRTNGTVSNSAMGRRLLVDQGVFCYIRICWRHDGDTTMT
jgi:hypothetical protein